MRYIISVEGRYPRGVMPRDDGWLDLIVFIKEDQAVECQQLVEYTDGVPAKLRREE